MTRRYKAVIFDIGDTLMRSAPSNADVIMSAFVKAKRLVTKETANAMAYAAELWTGEQIMREQNSAPRMPDDEFERHIDEAVLEKYRAMTGCSDADGVFSYTATRRTARQRKLIDEDAYGVLGSLKDRGYKLGIVSNFSANVREWLRENNILGYFSSVIISEAVGIEKPDPAIMRLCMDELSCEGSECLYVGDHPLDVLCAKRAGMSVAWLNGCGYRLPDYVEYAEDYRIARLTDLIDFL